MVKTVNILGTEYKVIREPFADKDIDGCCDYTSREIRIRDDNVNEVGDFDELMRNSYGMKLYMLFLLKVDCKRIMNTTGNLDMMKRLLTGSQSSSRR